MLDKLFILKYIDTNFNKKIKVSNLNVLVNVRDDYSEYETD